MCACEWREDTWDACGSQDSFVDLLLPFTLWGKASVSIPAMLGRRGNDQGGDAVRVRREGNLLQLHSVAAVCSDLKSLILGSLSQAHLSTVRLWNPSHVHNKAQDITTLKPFRKLHMTSSMNMGSIDWETVLKIEAYGGRVWTNTLVCGTQVWPGPTDSTDHQAVNYTQSQPSGQKPVMPLFSWKENPASLTVLLFLVSDLWAQAPQSLYNPGQ